MTQEEVIKLAKEAGFGNYAYEAAGIFSRFAAMVASTEREKCTNTQEFVTLPREVVERAIEALRGSETPTYRAQYDIEIDALVDLSAALEQPDAETPATVPEGWKLVPVEPNCSMVLAGERSLEQHDFLRLDSAYRAMLDAAPKPPTVKDSLTVEQPQANQPAMTPIAQRKLEDLMASGYTISGYSVYHERKHQHGFVTGAGLVGWWKPDGVEYPQPRGEQEPVGFVRQIDIEQIAKTPSDWGAMFGKVMGFNTVPVYTRPQPKREPLTDEQIIRMVNQAGWDAVNLEDGFGERIRRYTEILEAAHNK